MPGDLSSLLVDGPNSLLVLFIEILHIKNLNIIRIGSYRLRNVNTRTWEYPIELIF